MLFSCLWLVPAVPLLGFLVLISLGTRMPRRVVATIGAGSIGAAALVSLLLSFTYLTAPPASHAFTQKLWTWLSVGGFTPEFALRLDALSLVFILVITCVGFLIHLYATAYMDGEAGYHRFFAYMNLFVGAMLLLVLGDNLLLLYLGWEGVGICSFLLIGFWYQERRNGAAAMKAFITTRVGDTAFAIALFMLATGLGTLHIPSLLTLAPAQWAVGSGTAILVAALLLLGAVGKSAQLPLQVWLPDAMAGPTPVSALIHAATMVTAGVYLIARLHVLFTLAPPVLLAVAIVGVLTLLLAGFSALAQWDLKRVLAYSTISQIGYMFLALGVGAWSAAIFHFATHAFFKALLFLGAGVVIQRMHHRQDMREMGGLRRSLPLVFRTFVIGALSLAALPFVTAGFYSKDMILLRTWEAGAIGHLLWGGALFGALLTGLYTFRMVFYTFFGEQKHAPEGVTPPLMTIPLVILAGLSLLAGFLDLPPVLGHVHLFTDFLRSAFPHAVEHAPLPMGMELFLLFDGALASVGGIALAYLFFQRRRAACESWLCRPLPTALERFWEKGWGFDALYDRLFLHPFRWFARVNQHDIIDQCVHAVARGVANLGHGISGGQNGKVRWYAAGVTIGAILVIAILLIWK